MTQSYAICRLGKVSSWGSVGAMAEHHMRTRPTPNADPAPKLRPQVLHGSGDPESDVRAYIETRGIKPRKDAVLAVEVLLTASPEYFRPGRPDAYGQFDADRVDVWLKHQGAWLTKRYGDRLVSAVLHLDEATPHLHAVVVPGELKLDRRRKPPVEVWSLNARGLVGGAQVLRELQDDYAAAMAPLGLQRGVERALTGKSHTDIREYYQNPQAALRAEKRAVQAQAEALKVKTVDQHHELSQLRATIQRQSVNGKSGKDWLAEYDAARGSRRPGRHDQVQPAPAAPPLPQPDLAPKTPAPKRSRKGQSR